MKLSKQDVLHLATLSRLALSEKELDIFPEQLAGILDFVKTVNEADVSGDVVRDMTNVNTMRDDVVANAGNTQERNAIVRGMPDSENNYLSVPKIL